MNAAPLESLTPLPTVGARQSAAPADRTQRGSRTIFWLLSAFWVYVAISNVLYASNMQASLSQMKVEGVFAPADARLLQHLLLYPLFLFCMWRSLRTGWQPLWQRLPLQTLLALLLAVTAYPVMSVAEHLVAPLHPDQVMHPLHQDEHGWRALLPSAADAPTWIASASNFLVTYCFGLALCNGLAFYQRMRDAQLRSAALQRELSRAHLAALRMQLSPHTLFNLLHTIRGQIVWDPPAAQAMVVQLGDLLRRLLHAGERDLSRLHDELQLVTLYLQLQQKRFSDRLSIEITAPESLPRAWVPSLIMQPLVENAVLHGLAGHEGAVTIRVQVAAEGETLHLEVLNTMAPGRSAGPAGIGLANVRERLELQFDGRAHFSVQAARAGLWQASIRMPLLRDGPESPP